MALIEIAFRSPWIYNHQNGLCEYGNKINVGTEKVCAQNHDDTEIYIYKHIVYETIDIQ